MNKKELTKKARYIWIENDKLAQVVEDYLISLGFELSIRRSSTHKLLCIYPSGIIQWLTKIQDNNVSVEEILSTKVDTLKCDELVPYKTYKVVKSTNSSFIGSIVCALEEKGIVFALVNNAGNSLCEVNANYSEFVEYTDTVTIKGK